MHMWSSFNFFESFFVPFIYNSFIPFNFLSSIKIIFPAGENQWLVSSDNNGVFTAKNKKNIAKSLHFYLYNPLQLTALIFKGTLIQSVIILLLFVLWFCQWCILMRSTYRVKATWRHGILMVSLQMSVITFHLITNLRGYYGCNSTHIWTKTVG